MGFISRLASSKSARIAGATLSLFGISGCAYHSLTPLAEIPRIESKCKINPFYDRDGDCRISEREYFDAIYDSSNPEFDSWRIINYKIAGQSEHIHLANEWVQFSFSRLDTNLDGFLDESELGSSP